VHRHKDAVNTREGEPEMELAKSLVEASPEELWEPEEKSGEYCERGGNAHDEVEVTDDEVFADGSAREIVASQEDTGEASCNEERNETDGKERRSRKLNAGVPQCT